MSVCASSVLAQDTKTPSMMQRVQEAFANNPMLYLWLTVGLALSYLLGWFILRVLVKSSEMPHDAGCAGCLTTLVVFSLMLLAVLVMIVPVPDWIVWLILFVLFLVILLTLLTKGRSRFGPLFLLILLLFGAFIAWKMLGPRLATQGAETPKAVEGDKAGPVGISDTESMKDAVILTIIPSEAEQDKVQIGTGFYIDDHGTFLTCRHCVGDFPRIKVETHSKELLDADVVATDQSFDLALCKTNKKSPHYFALDAPGAVKVGDDVRTIGYPLGMTAATNESQIDPTLSGVASIGAIRSPDLLQISGAVNHGNSGGPLFKTTSAKVVGVVSARSEGGGTESIGWAISTSRVKKFMSTNGK